MGKFLDFPIFPHTDYINIGNKLSIARVTHVTSTHVTFVRRGQSLTLGKPLVYPVDKFRRQYRPAPSH
jgi:hypothetical protein